MEDEIKKRNMDCVYFLASPLTCKKGAECEYRHSESARLNPRDCYYWLNGGCLNPSCAFRHPPLEGLTETGSGPVQPSSNALIPSSKSSVPCYFYFNAYCIKGDQCPFLHDMFPAQKSLKAPPQMTTAHPPEKKTSTGSDTGPASVEVPAHLPGDTPEPIKQEHFKEVSQQPTTAIALEEPNPSAESSVPDFEEPSIKLSDENPLPPTEYGSPPLCLDQGSEGLVKECAEPDEWWESSPGFDVLVDDGSDQLPYDDDDADYIMARERESEILHSHGHLLQYDYDVPDGYDPTGYPDAGYMYEHGMLDNYNHADNNRYTPEYFQREHSRERGHSRERSLEVVPHRKRHSSRRNDVLDERDGMDLRDHLRKRRKTDGSSRKGLPSHARRKSRERSVRQGMGPSLHGRLASEVGNMSVSVHDTEFSVNDSQRSGWSGYPQSSRHVQSRLRERESRRRNRKPTPERSVRISSGEGSSSRKAESSQVKTDASNFTGPKTLAQIKEEKRRATSEEGNNSENYAPRHPTRTGPKDFEGPRPLNELLKEKRRSMSSNGKTNDLSCMATKEENHEHSGSWTDKTPGNVNSGVDNENQNTRYDSLDDDDNEIDDDTLHKNLQTYSPHRFGASLA